MFRLTDHLDMTIAVDWDVKPQTKKRNHGIQFKKRTTCVSGRKLMSVPMKLVKQKGQHLETFLQNFATSVEAQKPVPR